MILLRRVIGDALRARRQAQHRTLREVSTAANVSLGYLSEIERGQKEASSELLAERGPVDPDVAVALARGARERCRADWGLATTGVAGPDPQNSHAVGEVYVGLAGPRGADVRRLALAGDRAAIRAGSVTAALALCEEALLSGRFA